MNSKAFVTLVCLSGLASCAAVRPNLSPGSGIGGLPRIVRVQCDSDGLGPKLPSGYQGKHYFSPTGGEGQQIGGILAVLASAFVTQGVDFLGERLKAGGEEKERTLEAQVNFEDFTGDAPVEPVGCFDFTRGETTFRFAMLPTTPIRSKVNAGGRAASEVVNYRHVSFAVVGVRYKETVNKRSNGVRGLTLTFEIARPGVADAVTQSISLRNVEVGTDLAIPFEANPFTTAHIANPFLQIAEEAGTEPKVLPNLPFTLRVKLTEIRNANELYRFASGVAEKSNDDLTAALLKALGLAKQEEEDDGGGSGTPPSGQPPQGGSNNNEEEDHGGGQ